MTKLLTICALLFAWAGHALAGQLVLGQSLALGASVTIAAGPATFTDDFARTESPISTGWTSPSAASYGSISANGSAAKGDQHDTSPDYSLGQNTAFVSSPTFAANQSATITLASTDAVAAAVRLKTDGTGYMLYCFGGNVLIFHRMDGSAPFTGIKTIYENYSPGDTITLSVTGSTFTILHNGVSVGTQVDATYSTGQPGILIYNDSATIAAFSATDL